MSFAIAFPGPNAVLPKKDVFDIRFITLDLVRHVRSVCISAHRDSMADCEDGIVASH
jgi:hypothetical protein